jgi:phosphoglycerate dehydrogenase-like enzyme
MQKEQGWNLLRDIDRFTGSNILSVGMGAIGTAYLKKADALGAVCYGVRRSVHDKPEFVQKLVTVDEMDELLPEMDVVALSLPGTAEVKGMFREMAGSSTPLRYLVRGVRRLTLAGMHSSEV